MAGAVLLRAAAPVRGLELMRTRRVKATRDRDLCAGPGRLAQAFAVDRSCDGSSLVRGPLRIVAYRLVHRFRPEIDRLLVEIPAGGSPGTVIEAIEQRGGRVVGLEIEQDGDRRNIAADVELRGIEAPRIVADVGEVEGVLEVRWAE